MIIAWVLYYDGNEFRFRELSGSDFSHTDPEKWGLSKDCSIHLVLQQGRFLNAWIEGEPRKP